MSEEQSLKQKTAKGLFWGGLSSSVQQLLGLLFGVVLGRLLDPADYGMIGMLLSSGHCFRPAGKRICRSTRQSREVSDKDITLYSGSVSLLVLFFIFCSILQLR